MKIILNGKSTLAARFAQLDSARIQKKMAQEGSWNHEKLPGGLKKILRDPTFQRVSERAAQFLSGSAA